MNILLICSAGMSTSMLVEKMKIAAKKLDIDANIWAVGDAEAKHNVDKADVIMLGPQVKFLLQKTKDLVHDSKPVLVIDMLSYGRFDGAKILADALAAVN